MSKLMYRGATGAVRTMGSAKEGMVPVTGKGGVPDWRLFTAANLPYASKISGMANVAVALDYIFAQLTQLFASVDETRSFAKALDNQNDSITDALALKIDGFGRLLSDLATRLNNNVHAKVQAGRTTNPALIVDEGRQTVTLNLSAVGSFDDSVASIGASSISEAIVRLALKNREQAATIKQLQTVQQRSDDRLAELQARFNSISLEVSKMRRAE